MNYQANDIVVLRPEFGSRIYGIVSVGPAGAGDAYLAIKLDKGPITKCYHLGDDEILAKIGILEPEAVRKYLSQVEIPSPTDWESARSSRASWPGLPRTCGPAQGPEVPFLRGGFERHDLQMVA